MNAVQMANLVGRYIRMDRPATSDELAAGDPPSIGMECTVMRVADYPGGDGQADGVEVVADYGYSYVVREGDGWTFTVWSDEATAKQFR
jgi:hypothetical protein